MFGFFKKKPLPPAAPVHLPSPPICRSNPGRGVTATIGFANGQRTWSEHVDVVALAAEVFEKYKHVVSNNKTWIDHPESGFKILPLLVEFQPLDNGGVRTVTTVQVNHSVLAPQGIFEFQHSNGSSTADSISKGLDQWIQTDFVTLLDALKPKPVICTVLSMSFPAEDGKPARTRRAILGPVAHYMKQAPIPIANADQDEHPFCPCCLLTRSLEVFKELIQGEDTYCLRLFAARDENEVPQADCRVNGENWEVGAQALRTYVKTWPGAGIEFRKQYVVIHTDKDNNP